MAMSMITGFQVLTRYIDRVLNILNAINYCPLLRVRFRIIFYSTEI